MITVRKLGAGHRRGANGRRNLLDRRVWLHDPADRILAERSSNVPMQPDPAHHESVLDSCNFQPIIERQDRAGQIVNSVEDIDLSSSPGRFSTGVGGW